MALTLSPMWYGLLRDLRPKAKNKPKASVLGLISPHSPWLVPLGIQATPSFRRQSEPQEDIRSLGPQAQRVWREARLAGVGLRWQGGWSVPLCLRHPPPASSQQHLAGAAVVHKTQPYPMSPPCTSAWTRSHPVMWTVVLGTPPGSQPQHLRKASCQLVCSCCLPALQH